MARSKQGSSYFTQHPEITVALTASGTVKLAQLIVQKRNVTLNGVISQATTEASDFLEHVYSLSHLFDQLSKSEEVADH